MVTFSFMECFSNTISLDAHAVAYRRTEHFICDRLLFATLELLLYKLSAHIMYIGVLVCMLNGWHGRRKSTNTKYTNAS